MAPRQHQADRRRRSRPEGTDRHGRSVPGQQGKDPCPPARLGSGPLRGAVYAEWLKDRNEAFRAGIQVATLDPFHGYKNALDDELEDAIAVLDAFHVVKLGTAAVDEVRRRVQQDTIGHRGRRGDPLCGIRNVLRCGQEKLTDRQQARLERAFNADERHIEVEVAWQCAQKLRAASPIRSRVPVSRGPP